MKTAFIAAAVLLPLTASAQSTVTVYGMLDASVVHYRYSATASRPTARLTTVASDASRLGLRGSEDLGDGLRAYFKLEHGLQADMGASTDAASFWSREAYVGIGSRSLGSIQLGSQYTPNLWMSVKTDPFLRFGVGGQPSLAQGVRGYPLLYTNAVQYISPAMSGVTARVMVAAGEGAATGKSVSLGLDYNAGPLYVGLAYDDLKVTAAAVGLTGSPVDSRTVALALAWDLKSVKLHAHLQTNATDRVDDTKVVLLGVSVPVGPTGEFRTTYTRRSASNDTGASLLAVGYMHGLSKRTSLLVNAARLDNQRSASFRMGPARGEQAALGLPGPGQDTTGLQMGVRHWF